MYCIHAKIKDIMPRLLPGCVISAMHSMFMRYPQTCSRVKDGNGGKSKSPTLGVWGPSGTPGGA